VNRSDITIRPETEQDLPMIDELVRRTFREHTGYSDGEDEVALIHEICAGRFYRRELSFVAECDGQLVGHFMFSAFPLSPAPEGGCAPENTDYLLLAPVAVHADHVHKGIGITMLRLGLAEAKKQPVRGILVEGDPRFYNRLGFETSVKYGIRATSGFPLENPDCMMVMETRPGSLAGANGYVVYDMYEHC